MQYRFQNLLHRDNSGEVTGAFAPVMLAQAMAEQNPVFKGKFYGLLRVHIGDYQTGNDYLEIFEKGEGLSSHDHVVMLHRFSNTDVIQFYNDEGHIGVPIALGISNKRSVTITKTYRQKKDKYVKSLSDEDIKELFNYLFDNINLFDVK